MTNMNPNDILVGSGEGETISSRDERGVEILTARERLTVTWSRYSPGERGPDPHVHHQHTDAFYVLEGEITYGLGPEDEPVRMPAGGFVAVPPDVSHSFRNEGAVEGRFLNFHSPDGGFAEYMRGARDGRSVGFDSFDRPDDGGRPAEEAIVSRPGEGERHSAGHSTVTLKGVLPDLTLAEWELGGEFEGELAIGQVAAFYVLEGDVEIAVDGASQPATPGTLASVPPGARYALMPNGNVPARALTIHAPAGGFADRLIRDSTGRAS